MIKPSRLLLSIVGCLVAGGAGADGYAAQQIVAEPAFSWTGFYAGAQLGGVANFGDVSDPLGPSGFGNPNIATGAFAGGQVGYNYQSGMWVYGVEAELALPDADGTSTCSSLSGTFINSSCKIDIDTFGALTGRIGITLGPDNRALLYGKAGAAWITGDLHTATNDATTGAAGNTFTVVKTGISDWGWTLGAGAEYALPGNWSVKAEYDYAGFGRRSVHLPASANIDIAGAIIDTTPARTGHLSSDLHQFKLGLNYRFGAPVADDAEAVGLAPLKDSVVTATSGYGLEVGGRYWYSWGRSKYDLGLSKSAHTVSYSLISRLTYDDMNASTGEAVARLTAPWNLFAKGFIGGGNVSGGHMNDEDFNIDMQPDSPDQIGYTNTISPKSTGSLPGYGTIDVGYDWWRSADYRFGTYVGYNYYREKYGAYGCAQTMNQSGPCGLASDGNIPAVGHPIIDLHTTWQSMRIGATGEFYLAPGIKLSADAAYLPYVSYDAKDTHYRGNSPAVASINPLTGYGTGTQLELMLSYDVTANLSIGAGARYWAMWTDTGSFRRTYSSEGAVNPANHQHIRAESERMGVLGQVMYKFD